MTVEGGLVPPWRKEAPSSDYTATAAYLANSPLVGQITFNQSSTVRLTTTKQYDFLNRLASIALVPSSGNPLVLWVPV